MLFLDGIPGPIEASPRAHARAHAALGRSLRRAGRSVEAREPLRTALDLAHHSGDGVLAEEILAELRAAGARPRRWATTGAGALTRSERRVAELAAAGRQNKQIAEELVVTLATVEYHLRNSYRKLGITSRSGLPRALGMAPRSGLSQVTVGHLPYRGEARCRHRSSSSPPTV